jgi:glycerol-3-phosphate dehydrogenase
MAARRDAEVTAPPTRGGGPSPRPDAIIVGGGMQGAMLALECLARGRRPLLIERDRFGRGATGNSFGIIHGGLRYLQALDLPRWKRSRREQLWFAERFPDAVTPLRCVMPLYRGAMRSPALFRAAFVAQKVAGRATRLATDADTGLLSAEQTRSLYPMPARGLIGAAWWDELLVPDMPALVRAIVAAVVAEGGIALEGHEPTDLLVEGGRIAALGIRDIATGEVTHQSCDTLFLCSGAATQDLATRFDRPLPELSARVLAFNLLLDAPAPADIALALSPTPGRGRSLFLREHEGKLLAGTAYAPVGDLPVGAPVPAAEIDAFLADVIRAAPALAGVRVLEVWSGRLPDRDGIGVRLRDRDVLWDHGRNGGPHGLYSVTPTKLTTAHAHACDVLDSLWPDHADREAA